MVVCQIEEVFASHSVAAVEAFLLHSLRTLQKMKGTLVQASRCYYMRLNTHKLCQAKGSTNIIYSQ
uniref:Putative ovule protein n=1 Tax=Solanum chacoense TaxID=4108 RepID=A0A0V0GRR2_SOLCH